MDAAEVTSPNRLLAALEPDDRRRLVPHLERVDLELGAVLLEPEQEVRHVWFPESCVISLAVTTQRGGATEGATIGREGMDGIVTALGSLQASARSIVQVPGFALRLPREPFLDLHQASPPFRRICQCYIEALFSHVLQSVACGTLHSVEARLARWLLLLHDRIEGHTRLPLTQEFLADMLGVRRPTLTTAAQALQRAGLIAYRRGEVAVLDRMGLEAASCECYNIVRKYYGRLMPCACT